MLFDSHCHLNNARYDGVREEILDRLKQDGIGGILVPGWDLASSQDAMMLSTKHEKLVFAAGIHPQDCADTDDATLAQIANLLKHDKCVALGEIGLDYHYDKAPRPKQMEVFEAQLSLASQLLKPVLVHDRQAHADILDRLKAWSGRVTGVLHCFSGSSEMARQLVDLGYFISLGGPVTFQNAAHSIEVARNVPLSRLLIETDGPYLAPHPFRGQLNMPAYVRYVAMKIAQIRGETFESISRATFVNACSLFGLQKNF